MAHVPSVKTVEALINRPLTPEPLRSWLAEELLWCEHDADTRSLLCAALEGLHGIPDRNRDTAHVPLWAAAELCRRVLATLALWWDVDKRAGLSLKAQNTQDEALMLGWWCRWRVTARAWELQARKQQTT